MALSAGPRFANDVGRCHNRLHADLMHLQAIRDIYPAFSINPHRDGRFLLVPDQQEVTMRKATIILASVLTLSVSGAWAMEKGATPQDVVQKVKQAASYLAQ